MKLTHAAASLLVLGLFAAPGFAEEAVPQPAAEVAQIPAEVQALLDDKRPLPELTVKELTQRIRQTRGFIKAGNLPKDVVRQLRQVVKAARDERAARQQASGQQPSDEDMAGDGDEADGESAAGTTAVVPDSPTKTPDTTTAEAQPPIGTQIPDEVLAYLKDARVAKDLSQADLRARIQSAQKLAQMKDLPKQSLQQIRARLQADRAEMQARRKAGQQTGSEDQATTDTGAPDQQDVKKLDQNAGTAEAEAKAKAILAGTTRAEDLSDQDLRARLQAMRQLMQGNQLSRDTARQLRQKLAAERKILRARIAAQGSGQAAGGTAAGGTDANIDPSYMTDVTIVLRDRRPSDRLGDRELRRRIQVYRDAIVDERYAAAERARWRRLIELDRRLLRQRLVELRRQRQLALRDRKDQIDINLSIDGGASGPADVDAAEAGDSDLEDVLAAAPRRKFARRYSVEEIERSAELRQALPRVEIDTIHFGFNEGFVREEEVGNLDRIGEIMERILAVHPNEVFLIEGHTDAVGSDAYNLQLSRQRASAVKQALVEYFVIPPENLKTAGYGERFLKIPTAEEEPENRRVSVSRATALLGDAGG